MPSLDPFGEFRNSDKVEDNSADASFSFNDSFVSKVVDAVDAEDAVAVDVRSVVIDVDGTDVEDIAVIND
ncbi:hypothetical protein BGW38_006420 [Lunasporangiospora selenospora]|uniref:Uncharacterized protein n=1 Tax=Lunasporangiospora selenospora TaxID=979761 RepID=A0A9P6KI36_9FUNG|nr:hypothetical protein BGW38_006420 [Lunasporangiospora selenospora]